MSASEVQLNSKVVLVELHQSESGGGSITITTDSEQKRRFDGVVMTTPLGWLKVHKHAFTPSLEPRLLQASRLNICGPSREGLHHLSPRFLDAP